MQASSALKRIRDDEEEECPRQPNEVQQPAKKISQIVKGQEREYHFVKTVKSVEDLDKFRFQVIPFI